MMTHPPARRPEFVCRVQVSLELQSTPVSQAAFNFEANESTANAVKVEADDSEEEDESPNMILEEKVRVQTDVFFRFACFVVRFRETRRLHRSTFRLRLATPS